MMDFFMDYQYRLYGKKKVELVRVDVQGQAKESSI